MPALIKALKSKEEEGMLPSFAAEALGKLGPAAEPAIPALIETMKQNQPFIADQAAEALGKIGRAAVPAAGGTDGVPLLLSSATSKGHGEHSLKAVAHPES